MLKAVSAGALAAPAQGFFSAEVQAANTKGTAAPFAHLTPSGYSTLERQTDLETLTHYNNYYEFATEKNEAATAAQSLSTIPWKITIEGLVAKPKTLDMEKVLRLAPLEERVYRLRCVEAWSLVVPWAGFSLSHLLRQVQPLGSAKFVEFISYYDPAVQQNARTLPLDWPYMEALRLDEAMHPLTLLAVGLYGAPLPKQSGAPVRLVVPWKYGFKSAKSIVKIRFTEEMPRTIWMRAAPAEYGFYSNVNPNASRGRWSQEKERRLGEFWRRDTQLFNGYAQHVADLYRGMDLIANY